MVGMYDTLSTLLISHRRCGLAYYALHAIGVRSHQMLLLQQFLAGWAGFGRITYIVLVQTLNHAQSIKLIF